MTPEFPRTLTVVFSFATPEAFDTEWTHLHPLFLAEGVVPVKIHAMSRDDEVRRTQLIEEAAYRYTDVGAFKDVVRDLCCCPDLSKWKWP